jgi:hypothetical protein
MSQRATAQVNQVIPVIASSGTYEQLAQGVDETEETTEGEAALEVDEAVEEPRGHEPVEDPETKALLAQELIERWERLASAATQARTLEQQGSARSLASAELGYPSAEAYRLVDWGRTFAEELDYVQVARNTVAHARPIDEETLRQAVRLARKLEASLPIVHLLAVDPRRASVEFERRLSEWLHSEGVHLRDVSTRRTGVDFLGDQDGRTVLAEAKLTVHLGCLASRPRVALSG